METDPCSGQQANPSRPPSPPDLLLHNRCGALECEGQANEDVDEGPSGELPRMSQSVPHIMTAPVKKKRRVIVIGYFLLRGTEGPICRPDPSHREICCLPVAQVRDVAKKLPGLVRSSNYYPQLVMQVGGDEIAERSPKAIKRISGHWGNWLKDQGHRWCFPHSHQWQGRTLKGTGKYTINRCPVEFWFL